MSKFKLTIIFEVIRIEDNIPKD